MSRTHDDEKLRKLAADAIEGKVLFASQVPPELIPMVFMPLTMMSPEQIDQFKKEDVVELYEEYSTLAPSSRSINGFPMFFSFKSLTKDDYEAYLPIHRRMKAAIDLAKAGAA